MTRRRADLLARLVLGAVLWEAALLIPATRRCTPGALFCDLTLVAMFVPFLVGPLIAGWFHARDGGAMQWGRKLGTAAAVSVAATATLLLGLLINADVPREDLYVLLRASVLFPVAGTTVGAILATLSHVASSARSRV